MTPFYFGAKPRRLFGIYTPSRAGTARGRAVLICNPWGQEYLRAHRSLRHLCNILSGAGCHVMRFDYYGTGDSAGEHVDTSLSTWEADIETAIDELLDMTGASRVTLVGLRLGASVAAAVAARRGNRLDGLVLWDPVVSGAEYLAELTEAAQHAQPGSTENPLGPDVLGFCLTAVWARDLETVDLTALVPRLPARTLAIVSRSLTSHTSLAAGLSAAQGTSEPLQFVDGPPPWLEEEHTGAGIVPVELCRRIAEWLP